MGWGGAVRGVGGGGEGVEGPGEEGVRVGIVPGGWSQCGGRRVLCSDSGIQRVSSTV